MKAVLLPLFDNLSNIFIYMARMQDRSFAVRTIPIYSQPSRTEALIPLYHPHYTFSPYTFFNSHHF